MIKAIKENFACLLCTRFALGNNHLSKYMHFKIGLYALLFRTDAIQCRRVAVGSTQDGNARSLNQYNAAYKMRV
jgi:hypothetical protein